MIIKIIGRDKVYEKKCSAKGYFRWKIIYRK